MPSDNKKNIVCVKWGTNYSSNDVNKLYANVIKNTSYNVDFYCFTDDSKGLDDRIIVKPMLDLKHVYDIGCQIYLKEAGLCDDNLGGLKGQRVLYFDLDSVIVDNIDCFFDLPKNDEFFIIKDWNHLSNKIGQSSCYSWVVGTLGFVKDYFEANYASVYKKFGSASQEYLSDKVVEKYGKLNFWPKKWCRSFKVHCLPSPFLPFARRFIMAKIPVGAKVICFHGLPKAEDAKNGFWPEKNPIKRFFYKHLRPVDWIEG